MYANFSMALALGGNARSPFQTRNLDLYAITLRYERPWYGISLPISYNKEFGVNIGTTLRAGPLVVGSANLFTGLFEDDPDVVNLYAALKVPILGKR